jgi:hypothetical protein
MECGASLAGIDQGFADRVDRYAGDPADRSHGRTLAKHVEDLNAGLCGKLVHTHEYMYFHAWRQAKKFSLAYSTKTAASFWFFMPFVAGKIPYQAF